MQEAALQKMRAEEKTRAEGEQRTPEAEKDAVIGRGDERGIRRRGRMPRERGTRLARTEHGGEQVRERLGEGRSRVGHARGGRVIAAVPGRARRLDGATGAEMAAPGDEGGGQERESSADCRGDQDRLGGGESAVLRGESDRSGNHRE